MQEMVNTWNEAGKILDVFRREEIRKSRSIDIIPLFDEAFRSILWRHPSKPTSGLVEFQRLIAKMR